MFLLFCILHTVDCGMLWQDCRQSIVLLSMEAGAKYINKGGASGISDLAGPK